METVPPPQRRSFLAKHDIGVFALCFSVKMEKASNIRSTIRSMERHLCCVAFSWLPLRAWHSSVHGGVPKGPNTENALVTHQPTVTVIHLPINQTMLNNAFQLAVGKVAERSV